MHELPKEYQREALLPLYREHATYLLRCLKTAITHDDINIERFIEQIPTFISVATCHEIAINANTSLELETHRNPLGKETEYTHHPAAKKVGRDLRVKIIWELVQSELVKDPTLGKYEPYTSLEACKDKIYRCPYCDNELARIVQYRVVVGQHHDGTDDFYYQTEWVPGGWCEHVLMEDNDVDTQYSDELNTMFDEDEVFGYSDIRDYDGDFHHILNNAGVENDEILTYNEYGNVDLIWRFVEDMNAAVNAIEQYIREDRR